MVNVGERRRDKALAHRQRQRDRQTEKERYLDREEESLQLMRDRERELAAGRWWVWEGVVGQLDEGEEEEEEGRKATHLGRG